MSIINGSIIASSIVHVATDLIFSLIPISFIRELTRPRSEKIFLGVLMGLGIVVSTFAILRTVCLKEVGKTGDLFYGDVMPTLWANLELHVAMIATTLPTLKSVVQKCLVGVGAKFYELQDESKIGGKLVTLGFLEEEGDTLEWANGKPVIDDKVRSEVDKHKACEVRFAKKIKNEIGFMVDEKRDGDMSLVRRVSEDIELNRTKGTQR